MLEFGLLVNPLAGAGGGAGLKGSDGIDVELARARGGQPRGEDRCDRFLAALGEARNRVSWRTWGGAMGERCLRASGARTVAVLGTPGTPSTARDTATAAKAFQQAGVDLLVFVGGDGTARDLVDVIGEQLPVLGIPAGVKMHSGVFATTPEAAAEVVRRLQDGGLVASRRGDVKDIDEQALRRGRVNARIYGELTVPEVGGFVQHTKEGGRENETLAVDEIAADIEVRLQGYDRAVALGPGGTLAAVKAKLGIPQTLLGVDVWRPEGEPLTDVGAADLVALGDELGAIVVSFTRRQGFLLGRGNQQFSPAILRRVGRANLWIVGTRSKLLSLEGRPLLVDTDDAALDSELAGLIEITAGFEDRLVYRVGADA